jgi:hypothetical protein
MKKIKSTNTILKRKKNHKKEKKTMWRNTIAIHIVLKKKNYEAEFSTSSILKKITKTILKKKHKKIKKKKERKKKTILEEKKNKKKHVGKVKAEFSISSILKK